MARQKILMICTGGTIASATMEKGLAPLYSGAQLLSFLPKVEASPSVAVKDLLHVDSTDMTTEMRLQIAQCIWQQREAYDGFVVVHGTDTMAYTAAFLYHALEHFPKPVMLTGAQEPISVPETDALDNLRDAIRAACSSYCGVAVVFGGRIIRGSCAYKYHTKAYDAFRSVGREDDGSIRDGTLFLSDTSDAELSEPHCHTRVVRSVGVAHVFPDLRGEVLRAYGAYDALILLAYGSGGIQTHLLQDVAYLLAQETRVYMASQCMEGGVQLGRYAVGSRALTLGLLALGTTTIENAIAEIMLGKR